MGLGGVVLGFALTVIGLLMLIVAAVSAVMREVESHSETARGRERTAAS